MAVLVKIRFLGMYAAYWVRYRTESLAQEIKENLKEATASQTVPDTWADLDLTHLIPAMDLKEGGKGLIVKLRGTAAFYSMSPN